MIAIRRLGRRFAYTTFIASRFLRNRHMHHGAIPGVLSTAGISVGVVALIVVMSVMNGFQLGFIEDILEIRSYHIRVVIQETDDQDAIENLMESIRSVSGVSSVTPLREIQTLAAGAFSEYQPIMLRGTIAPDSSGDLGFANQVQIDSGVFDLSERGNVVLGGELADSMDVDVGTFIRVVSLAGSVSLRPATEELLVVGIFRSGFYEIDSGLAFCSLDARVFDPAAMRRTELGVKITNRFRDTTIAQSITPLLSAWNAEIISWREYNRAFFGALRIEKLTMALLLALIFVVVSFNIAQFLTRNVLEKREDISVLKAMGAGPSSIRHIYLLQGGIIGIVGGSIGASVGLLVVSHVDAVLSLLERATNGTLELVRLLLGESSSISNLSFFSPTYFYLVDVPVRILPIEIGITIAVAIASTLVASFVASRKLAQIEPQRILRYE